MRRQKDRAKADSSGRATQTAAIAASPVDHAEIERRAYEIFQSRGCADGLDLDDWLTAERELSESRASVSDARRAAAQSPPRERQA